MLGTGALIPVPELDNAQEARCVFPRQWQASLTDDGRGNEFPRVP